MNKTSLSNELVKQPYLDNSSTRAFIVEDFEVLTVDAVAITLIAADGESFTFHAGQFISLSVMLPDGSRASRSYSIASTPDREPVGRLTIGVKRVPGGLVSTYLTANLKVGEAIEVRGPFGSFGSAALSQSSSHTLLIAGGSGITPLLSIAKFMLYEFEHSRVTLLYRAHSNSTVMFRTELAILEAMFPARFQIKYLLTVAEISRFTDWIAAYESIIGITYDTQAYVCGPESLMDSASKTLIALGVQREKIYKESFVTQGKNEVDDSKIWKVGIQQGSKRTTCFIHDGESLLEASEREGFKILNSCRVGSCGTCKVSVKTGSTRLTSALEDGLAEIKSNEVLSCVCTPTSDMLIDLPLVDNPIDTHPAVVRWFKSPTYSHGPTMSKEFLREIALECGADDVGFVSVGRNDLASELPHLSRAFPQGKTYICLVRKMNTANVRSPERSIANADFHHTMDDIQVVARKLADKLSDFGLDVFCAPPAFPMEMDRFPERGWVIAHKTIAVASGVGMIGLHRNVIHPKFGNFILLDTIVIDREIDHDDLPLTENPCIGCNLCVAACPVGAINADGHFDFTACYTHNYREFMSGFSDWVEQVADAKSAKDYRNRVTDSETMSIWQSLSFGPNYKAAYCLSVCPAGSDVIGDFLSNRKRFINKVLLPLQAKSESIYVVPGSDAERYVRHKFPHKNVRRVSNGLRVRNIEGFLNGLKISFQRGKAKNLSARYHFIFTGKESAEATVIIGGQKIEVLSGLAGKPSLTVTVDSNAWLRFLRKDTHIVSLLFLRKLRLKGSPRLLAEFGKVFL